MSNHPQLELFFTNAIWSTSHFIQNFLRVPLTLRISPSDYKALPPTLDLDPPTANFPLDTTAQRCQKLGSKSGWIFAEDPERRLEDGLEWMWGILGGRRDWTQCTSEWCFGCRNGMWRLGDLAVGRSTGTRFPENLFTSHTGGLINYTMPDSEHTALNHESDACFENQTQHGFLSLHYTSAGHVYCTSSLVSNMACFIGEWTYYTPMLSI